MVGAEAVAGMTAELREVLPQQFDAPRLRHGDAAEQAEQGALAAAAGTVEENPFAEGKLEAWNFEAGLPPAAASDRRDL
jgi:hypothetical protein